MKNSILKLFKVAQDSQRYLFPLFLLILIVPSFASIIRPGSFWDMHDDMQIIRQVEMEKCFQDGQLPCRWAPDLGFGYGYPLFNYYPPLPYFVGQVFRIVNFSYIDTIKLTVITQILLSAFFMYLLVSSLYSRTGGLLSALFYTYAPYHAVNIYVRGAMNEAWAAVFFPLIFYFSYKFITSLQSRNILGLSLSFSGLLLSHNPMVVAFTPIFIIWCLFLIFSTNNIKKNKQLCSTTIKLTLSIILSLGLSAFFTFPALLESKLVKLDSLFTGYYTYSAHFASLNQLLISNFWGNGHSVWGLADGLSFSVGYLHWLLPLFMVITLCFKYYRYRKLSKLEITTLLIIFLGFSTVFMAHERSTFIWKIFSPLQKLQFPWRYLNISNFLLSLSIGLMPILFKNIFFIKSKYLLPSLIIILLLAINVSHFIPIKYYQSTDQQKLSGDSWKNQTSSGINDYLPQTATNAPIDTAKQYVDQIIPPNVTYQLSGQKKGTDWQFFNINLNKPAVVYLSVLAFPEFEVTNNNVVTNYQTEPKFGRISLSLDAGQHQIYLKLRNTPLRRLANIISLISTTILLIMFIKTWKKTK